MEPGARLPLDLPSPWCGSRRGCYSLLSAFAKAVPSAWNTLWLSQSSSPFPPSILPVSYSVFGVQARCHSFGKPPLTPRQGLGPSFAVELCLFMPGIPLPDWATGDHSGGEAESGLTFSLTGSCLGCNRPQPYPCLI